MIRTTALDKPAPHMFFSTGQTRRMHLRPATPEDAEAISAAWASSVREICMPAYPQNKIAKLEDWIREKTPTRVRNMIALEDFFLVAEEEERIAGFVCATFSLNAFALFVDPNFTRRGVGSSLFRCMERAAAAAGVKELFFHSSLNAVDFYRKMGASVAGAREEEPLPHVPMRKPLSS